MFVLFPTRHIKAILHFLYAKVVRDNWGWLGVAALAGITNRFLSLFGFFVTFQAIVAAFRPDIIVAHLTAAFHKLGIQVTATVADVELIIVLSIVAVYGVNLMVGKLYLTAICTVSSRVASFEGVRSTGITSTEDSMLIENMPEIVRSVASVFEISLFLLGISIFLLSFSIEIGSVVLALVVLLAVLLVMSDRRNLREIHEQAEARKSYMNSVPSGKGSPKLATDTPERERFLSMRRKRMERTIVKPHIDSFMGAAIIAIIIYMLFQTQLSAEGLAGLLVLFVVGIRYAVSTGQQLATHVSRLLELRKHLRLLENILSPKLDQAHSEPTPNKAPGIGLALQGADQPKVVGDAAAQPR